MSDPYTTYARPKSGVGPVFRGFVIALGVLCALAALGWGGYRVALVGRWLAAVVQLHKAHSTVIASWVYNAATLVEGVLLVIVLAPTALTAVVYAIRRAPTGRWRWIVTLVVGIVCFCIIVGLRGGSKPDLDKYCDRVSQYGYYDWCYDVWAPNMGISAGTAVAFLLFMLLFTVFFYKNQPVGGSAGHVPLGMQPLGHPYAFAAGTGAAYSNQQYPPPAQPSTYDPYAPSGQYPYPTPYGTTYGSREADDKDSVHSRPQSIGYGAQSVGYGGPQAVGYGGAQSVGYGGPQYAYK
ncbi:hypothetical protein Q8F55_004068 [Vanrija albida]|uniref:MARVEL domain-containing protein n=1 Tax=Vanrija albida TaxID=181172 RepID=A0ABR3Q5Q9_9TREE